jgi:hypothetical protein
MFYDGRLLGGGFLSRGLLCVTVGFEGEVAIGLWRAMRMAMRVRGT